MWGSLTLALGSYGPDKIPPSRFCWTRERNSYCASVRSRRSRSVDRAAHTKCHHRLATFSEEIEPSQTNQKSKSRTQVLKYLAVGYQPTGVLAALDNKFSWRQQCPDILDDQGEFLLQSSGCSWLAVRYIRPTAPSSVS